MSRKSLFGLLLAVLFAAGCSSSTTGSGDVAKGDGSGDGGAHDGAVDGSKSDGSKSDGSKSDGTSPDGGCVPIEINCNDLCGPITDNCTGEVHHCGTCSDGLVCDLGTHECVEVYATCEELGAECGMIKNTCGFRLDCKDCPPSQECDPDSNTCIPCTQVTCQDLGYQCGKAWTGCGPKNNKTDCGTCPDGEVCNDAYNTCEPDCTPDPTAAICLVAAADGVECGLISDGCGGLVDCGGCPDGESCGVRGVGNRCDVPEPWPECAAAGRECGKLISACGGIEIHCGDCPDGEVCNSNGVCGAPCTPKTCPVDYPNKCGKQLDDGCSGKLDCKCGGGEVCSTGTPGDVGDCVPFKKCADYGATGSVGDACSNGASPSFPRGDDKNLTCACGAGLLCISNFKVVVGGDTGTCCENANLCNGSSCEVENTCTKEPINCCKNNEYCDATANTCVAKKTCADYTDRRDGSPCSTRRIAFFDDGTGQGLHCPCIEGTCIDPVPTDESPGTCCVNTNVCDGTSCTVIDSCTGDIVNCCGPNQYCDPITGTCLDKKTCADYTTGADGQPCSTTPHFDDDAGGLLVCPCDPGGVCLEPTSAPGTCCFNTAQCDGSSCTVTNTCTNNPINCCTGTQYCDTATDTCKNKKTCADYTTRAVGQPCSTTPYFDDAAGGLLTCNCRTSGGFANNTCVGGPPGVCTCEPRECDCSIVGQSDRCGGTLSGCGCTAPEVCFNKSCCLPYQCPAGAAGDECDVPHSTCGQTVICKCSGPAYNTCGGGGTPNVCGCTPISCVGKTGTIDDGCGSTINCGG